MESLFEGTISTKTTEERRCLFRQLMDQVFLPQRQALLASRDSSWQSAYVDDDGYFAELVASIVTGVPGVTRRGVTRSVGDLADGTEVKKGYRLDPNIDFILTGVYRAALHSLDFESLPPEFAVREILSQLNSNACSVQILDTVDDQFSGGVIGVTVGKDAFAMRAGELAGELRLSKASLPFLNDGEKVTIALRQERGHINFGNKTRSQLANILASQPILVFYQHDLRGRPLIAVIRCDLSQEMLHELLDRIYGAGASPDLRKQVQPYLMPDNRRDALALSKNHSVGRALGGRLLALGVQSKHGFEVKHWDPLGSVSVVDAEGLLTENANLADCPEFGRPEFPSGSRDTSDLAEWFFLEGMVKYYDRLRPYCELTATTRNMGFGNLSQHLVSLVTGIQGTRSGARGADLIEIDGRPSEVKLATGEKGGDAMSTEDSPRLTLGWGRPKMLSWARLFAVRIVDLGEGLRVLVQAPTASLMDEFRSQVDFYFDGRLRTESGGLQYHATDKFPHDSYGPVSRRLSFTRIADFGPNGVYYPNAVPQLSEFMATSSGAESDGVQTGPERTRDC